MDPLPQQDFIPVGAVAGLDEGRNAGALNTARFKGDDKLFVEFYKDTLIQERESFEKGRPIYTEKIFIRIMVPGDRRSIIERPVDNVDKMRFKAQYEAYMETGGNDALGTPLASVSWMNKARVKEYEFFGIRTVEQLAGAPDSVSSSFMGFHDDQRMARGVVEGADKVELRQELDDKDQRIADLEARLVVLEEEAPVDDLED